eukprot:TRINITY_DN36506_c0_g1_i1.p1 TRINITY_DN36506_c0_g1~~TRINITY_DN36506_c0_g1_i1.p1  ORF type:complete len:136 (-),score=14.15 TRINITY_DN36506_c0_g1_i1:124-531(-)
MSVSTAPKMTKIFSLKVIIPKVNILGGPHLYIQRGNFLQLECMISHVMSAPQFVMWEHGGRVVPGKTVHTQAKHDIVTTSVLTIDQVTSDSAGMYSCMPDNISPATINIHVVNSTEEQLAVINSVILYQSDIILS